MLAPFVKKGRTLEIGSGAGLIKELWSGDLVSTDILKTPWIDFQADAENLTFNKNSFDNILGIDLLHHLKKPHYLFTNAKDILTPGGKIILIEPWITPLSFIFYKLMHHEKISFSDTFTRNETNPWDANIALPNLIFSKMGRNFISRHSYFKIELIKKFSFFDFQLVGGFKPWSIIKSVKLYNLFLRLDKLLSFLMPLIGFRVLIVLKKE